MPEKGLIVGASLGNCVHVAGVLNFLELARREGYQVAFLGPAVPPERLAEEAARRGADIIAASYRLSPEPARQLFEDLRRELQARGLLGRVRLLFGGTPEVAQVARQAGLFERVFDGSESEQQVLAFLRGEQARQAGEDWGQTLLERIEKKKPWPLIRHHFGRPSLEETIEGARRIAQAGVLDVLSIGPDQNAQESFFRPNEMDPRLDGAGGVPLRKPEDLEAIYQATRCGNYPLLRCYSGTRDLIKWAEVQVRTIRNAWAAIPICWYNVLDGRSNRPLEAAIEENMQAIAWYAQRGIPVECNESHHWSLRWAPDAVAVAMAYIAAYIAKKLGVRHYVAQYMFNTPRGVSFEMDMAKMLAKIDLIESLHDDSFTTLRQTRTGLMHLSTDLDRAKGQMIASLCLQIHLRPVIVHVVGYCEADHAATADELIESCKMAQAAIENWWFAAPPLEITPRMAERREELKAEAGLIMQAIRALDCGCGDPLACPRCLARAIRRGILDAPHLAGNPAAAGRVVTGIIDGAVRSLDPASGQPIGEEERLRCLGALW